GGKRGTKSDNATLLDQDVARPPVHSGNDVATTNENAAGHPTAPFARRRTSSLPATRRMLASTISVASASSLGDKWKRKSEATNTESGCVRPLTNEVTTYSDDDRTKAMKKDATSPLRIRGNCTRLKTCQPVAPKSAAASSRRRSSRIRTDAITMAQNGKMIKDCAATIATTLCAIPTACIAM